MYTWRNDTNEESHPRMNTEESFLNSSRIFKKKKEEEEGGEREEVRR